MLPGSVAALYTRDVGSIGKSFQLGLLPFIGMLIANGFVQFPKFFFAPVPQNNQGLIIFDLGLTRDRSIAAANADAVPRTKAPE